MWLKWLPWRYVLSRFARSRGFIDPVAVLSRLRRFAQPSEAAEPIELLREGVVFHSRGLINSRAIQHNLDWVWPYWVERQFAPLDEGFIPRSFSITHVNLTHRNWTAVGLPDCDRLPIVDPRGLVTPLFDGWSLDAWIVPDRGDGPWLLPSREEEADQRLRMDGGLSVETEVEGEGGSVRSSVEVLEEDPEGAGGGPWCRWQLEGEAPEPGWLVVSARPANPEGISFIHRLRTGGDRSVLTVDEGTGIRFDRPADRVCLSDYRSGDVLQNLYAEGERESVRCDVGLATGAMMYRLEAERSGRLTVRIPLDEPAYRLLGPPMRKRRRQAAGVCPGARSWDEVLDTGHRLRIPDEKMQRLYDAAVRSLILHSPDEAYSGPYTDRRFWFRDAAFLCEAMLGVGLHDRVRRVIEHFPARQDMRGYFRSQEGEWDSNGAAIWTMDRYRRLSGNTLPDELVHAVAKGARWIRKQRLSEELEVPHAGLLPAGFSAEHLGPNDDYYWDDFWSVAGLRSAGSILRRHGDEEAAAQWEREAASLLAAVDRSIERTAARRDRSGVPASPYRRMDAGAIGSIVAGYPLRLWSRRDPRLLATVEYLLERCMVRCGFFQDMIHSGINAYLTLHLAQVLLRAEDPRWFDLMRTVADLASPTGQWPGIIHPRTGGGCMGDGQHLWASAEWVLMLRHCFVREEGARLVIGSGIPASWLRVGEPMELGPVPTPFGPVTVRVEPGADNALVSWEGDWRAEAPPIEVKLPGCAATIVRRGERSSVEVALPEEARRRTEVAK